MFKTDKSVTTIDMQIDANRQQPYGFVKRRNRLINLSNQFVHTRQSIKLNLFAFLWFRRTLSCAVRARRTQWLYQCDCRQTLDRTLNTIWFNHETAFSVWRVRDLNSIRYRHWLIIMPSAGKWNTYLLISSTSNPISNNCFSIVCPRVARQWWITGAIVTSTCVSRSAKSATVVVASTARSRILAISNGQSTCRRCHHASFHYNDNECNASLIEDGIEWDWHNGVQRTSAEVRKNQSHNEQWCRFQSDDTVHGRHSEFGRHPIGHSV